MTAGGQELVFLGTGASGGTPGEGRSQRQESSLLLRDRGSPGGLLIDATRDFPAQSTAIEELDLVLLTHAHGDACGGVPALRRWLAGSGNTAAIPTLAHSATIDRLRERYHRLDHLDLQAVQPGERWELAGWRVTAAEVPHASEPGRFPTYAWRVERQGRSVAYASDVSRLTDQLAAFVHGADVLVLDAALWRKSLPTHLRADLAVPVVCGWPVGDILLTQIGRGAPPHEELVRLVTSMCPRARPAYDGLTERLG